MALADEPVDVDWYTTREREHLEVLPWDHLDSGLDKDWLWEDWQDSRVRGRGRGLPLDAVLRLRRVRPDGHARSRSARPGARCSPLPSVRRDSPLVAEPTRVAMHRAALHARRGAHRCQHRRPDGPPPPRRCSGCGCGTPSAVGCGSPATATSSGRWNGRCGGPSVPMAYSAGFNPHPSVVRQRGRHGRGQRGRVRRAGRHRSRWTPPRCGSRSTRPCRQASTCSRSSRRGHAGRSPTASRPACRRCGCRR